MTTDHTLPDDEITRRDLMLADFNSQIQRLRDIFNMALPEADLPPQIPHYIKYSSPPVYDVAWAEKRILQVQKTLMDHIVRHIMSIVPDMKMSDPRLKGDYFSVAEELAKSRLNRGIFSELTRENIKAEISLPYIGISWESILDNVADEFKGTYGFECKNENLD